jgi:hypothetical protein
VIRAIRIEVAGYMHSFATVCNYGIRVWPGTMITAVAADINARKTNFLPDEASTDRLTVPGAISGFQWLSAGCPAKVEMHMMHNLGQVRRFSSDVKREGECGGAA